MITLLPGRSPHLTRPQSTHLTWWCCNCTQHDSRRERLFGFVFGGKRKRKGPRPLPCQQEGTSGSLASTRSWTQLLSKAPRGQPGLHRPLGFIQKRHKVAEGEPKESQEGELGRQPDSAPPGAAALLSPACPSLWGLQQGVMGHLVLGPLLTGFFLGLQGQSNWHRQWMNRRKDPILWSFLFFFWGGHICPYVMLRVQWNWHLHPCTGSL